MDAMDKKMVLVESFKSWDVAALLVTTIVLFWLLAHQCQDLVSPSANRVSNGPSADVPQPLRVADGKAMTYRLRGLSSNLDRQSLLRLVEGALRLVDGTVIVVKSLANDPSRRGEKIATVEFSLVPNGTFQHNAKAEWSIRVCDDTYGQLTLHFDTHFRGWTPLHSSGDETCTVDLIAVSGLASHAFGSFKERNGPHMWLRDSLPRDIPNTRIFTYGYDTHLEGSTSVANLDDLANEFQSKLKLIRSYQQASTKTGLGPIASPQRPLIFLGHSLGGILIKAV
ncbi:hypothetical protein F5X98DRAFT_98862 [Xylaria grammica]|nr:hypothetical protein F5X98DRAFT_98862 [Xylaria grammica]